MKTKLAGGMTIGSDPEVMLFSTEKGRIVSSIPVLMRDKHNPIAIGDAKMYADNVLVEAAFPPSDSKAGFLETIRSTLGSMQKFIGNQYELIARAAHVYHDEELKEKSCWEAGCNPNFDIYAKRSNLPAEFKSGLRTGSFHIHVGHDDLKPMAAKESAIRLLDIYLGCASVVFDGDESAPARRALYGKAGEFRPTSYGVEYRVLGNFALRSPALVDLVVDLVDHSIGKVLNGKADQIIKEIDQSTVINAINKNMKGLAKSVLVQAKLPKDLLARVSKTYRVGDSLTRASGWAIS